jgi:hypothetical protein
MLMPAGVNAVIFGKAGNIKNSHGAQS